MTTKKELLKQIKELQRKADAMPDDDGVWIPEEDDTYYYICDEGMIDWAFWRDGSTDQYRLASGNAYRTREQVLETRDRRLAEVRVLRRIAELNAEQGWTACFDGKQANYCIGVKVDVLVCNPYKNHKVSPIEYYGSQKTIETVMTEMEDDYRLMLGGNEK